MKENKKFILAIPTLIIIVVTIIGISLIFYNRNLKEMSREDARLLASKVIDINNISCEIVTQNSLQSDVQDVVDYKMKDNKVISIDDSYTVFEDLSQKVKIQIDDSEKTAYVYSVYTDEITNFQEMLYTAEKLLESEEYEYSFIDYETMNGIKCAAFSVANADTTFNIWLDRDNGMIVKMECHYKSSNDPSIDTTMYYRYQLNVVTEDDVKQPELDGYTVVEL